MRTPKKPREFIMYNVGMHPRTIALTIASFILGTISIGIAYAWSEPTAAPPNGNVAAPINVGSTDQVKNGGLGLNSLAVFGTLTSTNRCFFTGEADHTLSSTNRGGPREVLGPAHSCTRDEAGDHQGLEGP
jgi:hypothetical protein